MNRREFVKRTLAFSVLPALPMEPAFLVRNAMANRVTWFKSSGGPVLGEALDFISPKILTCGDTWEQK